jgi:Domain of unknown function (DUF4126)
VDLMTALGQTMPFAFASGLNLYATIAVLGLIQRFQLVSLPPQFEPFGHPVVIGVAVALYLVEFVADKIPWVDSAWDLAHTIVRPLGGAVVAITALGSSSPGMDALAGALGASVALASHATKAGARAAANTSPEPFSNWILSFIEDLVAIGLVYFATEHPVIALGITLLLLTLILVFATVIVRFVRRRFVPRQERAAGALPPRSLKV